ncbi:hypothetical protein AB0L70_40560 [Kribbella sp. NPDC051952]|uniref:hypothetical protein n=1 Tax=Kribbella sp. NPDC051952 TaxID=3154851 RepID=UPI00342F478A
MDLDRLGLQPMSPAPDAMVSRRSWRSWPRWWLVRGVTYLVVTVGATILSFGAGSDDYRANVCGGDPYGECDMTGIGGFSWAVTAVVACLAVAVAIELVLWSSRLARRRRDPRIL